MLYMKVDSYTLLNTYMDTGWCANTIFPTDCQVYKAISVSDHIYSKRHWRHLPYNFMYNFMNCSWELSPSQ